MRGSTTLVLAVLAAALCRVPVEAKPDLVAYAANPWNDPAGGPALGTGGAAVMLVAGLFTLNPMLAMAGVGSALVQGTECAIGAREHPALDADFRQVFATADAQTLPRALERSLTTQAACAARPGDAGTPPAAVIVVDEVSAMPGCGYADWSYVVTVTWHATRGDGRELLASRRLTCGASGARDLDAWLADRDKARREIEAVLAATGERIAEDLLSDTAPEKCCSFYATRNGLIRH